MPGGSRYTWGYVCIKTVLSMGNLYCSCLPFFGMSRWQKCCMIVEIPIFWLKQPVYYFVWICYKKLWMLFVGLMWLDDQEIPNLRAWTKTKWKKNPELSLNDYVAVFPAECPANPWTVSGGCTTFNYHQLGKGIQEVVARNECGCVCGQPC